MNRSLTIVTIAAALGLAACTSTPPAPDNTATTTPSSATTTPSNSVVAQVVTETVTKPVAPPAKPVIGSFGYGDLKLGMSLQDALNTKLIGPALNGDECTLHDITGTGERTWISKAKGVASVGFSAGMSSDGVGVGATEQKLKVEYTNLVPAGPNYSYRAEADNNPDAYFLFGVREGKLTGAYLMNKGQDCHNN
ncbi:hypothetical protein [Lentzea californiensis]|uniref:hypothetical protein n=1 Tax=Lentzea californiensis TaxID=438851 RepID=UPI0021646635|nr:hypothetical protein [Lentzea californiensis]MCR3747167.1 hypothetical protein [Lentzea californiensis]